MANGYKEWDFQNGLVLPFLTASEKNGGLGWRRRQGCSLSKVEMGDWILRQELRDFLKDGNKENRRSWACLAGEFAGDDDLLSAFIQEALAPKLSRLQNAAFVLRENITFRGKSFRLWNEPAKAGCHDRARTDQDFLSNACIVVDEIWYDRDFPLTGQKFKRRPDAAFFVNGLFLGLCELKTKNAGQTAADEGRRKIAANFVELAVKALDEERLSWDRATGQPWPGLDSVPAEIRNRVRTACTPFAKACHCVALDTTSVHVAGDFDSLLREVDEATKSSDRTRSVGIVTETAIRSFGKAPDILGLSGWDSVEEHLSSLYSVSGALDTEIHFFNQTQKARESEAVDTVKPRPAQRIMLYRTVGRVAELYGHEEEAKLTDAGVRRMLAEKFNGSLPPGMVEETVRNALLHRNGTECHSILLQGAAGLGKTKVIVWLARALAEAINPRSAEADPLFDCVLILTDRTELRKNVAEEAGSLRGCQDMVAEATTFAELRDGLSKPEKRILTVNIQKFPSIRNLADSDPGLASSLASRRVAIIIDEVHRSQNGTLHDATVDLFDEWGGLRHDGAKRNLIVGLTATPKEEILARFGEWEPPAVPGGRNVWSPFFSYSMKQAVADGVVLNPIQAVMRFDDVLSFNFDVISEESGRSEIKAAYLRPSLDAIYRDRKRQALIARRTAEIFAANTMNAIRKTGKALFACHSIEAAITMREELESALRSLADEPRFSDRAEYLKACPVLLLYSNRQDLPKCEELNGGKGQEEVIREFRRIGIDGSDERVKCRNAILVVVDKLLTGFDEKTLHTIFIDRGLDDVLLFQAVCRVNRTARNKRDCLVVDFSHDGKVSKNLAEVFQKYGGLTVSGFDSLTLMERMEKSYKELFDEDKSLSERWRMWNATLKGGKDSKGAVELGAWAEKLISDEPAKAEKLRAAAVAWRSSRAKLWGVLDFTRPTLLKHADERKKDFVNEIARLLKPHDLADGSGGQEPFFSVEDVGEAETWGAPIHGEMGILKERAGSNEKDKADEEKTIGGYFDSPDGMEDWMRILEKLMLHESEKAEAIARVKESMYALFSDLEVLDSKTNNGLYSKRVRDGMHGKDFPHDERLALFRKMFNQVLGQFKYIKGKLDGDLALSFGKRLALLMDDYQGWLMAKHGEEWR